jgi:hypothetical protein
MDDTAVRLLRRLVDGLRAPASLPASVELPEVAEEYARICLLLEGDLSRRARASLPRWGPAAAAP